MNRCMRSLGVLWVGSLLFLVAAVRAPRVVSACGDFGKDLVAWWKLDDGAGTLVSDSSGLSNDGEIRGDAAFTTDSLLGSAVDFYGDSGDIFVPHDPSLEPAVGTIEAWVKVADPQDSDIVMKTTGMWVRRGSTGGFGVYGLRIRADGSVSGLIGNDDPAAAGPWTEVYSPPGLITLGEWHHLAIRWDGASLDLFVDGAKTDSRPYVPVPGLGLSYYNGRFFGLAIATNWGGSSAHEFIGQIDDVRIYARARPDREIRADYRSKGKRPAKPLGHVKKEAKKKLKKRHKKHEKHEAHKREKREHEKRKRREGCEHETKGHESD